MPVPSYCIKCSIQVNECNKHYFILGLGIEGQHTVGYVQNIGVNHYMRPINKISNLNDEALIYVYIMYVWNTISTKYL